MGYDNHMQCLKYFHLRENYLKNWTLSSLRFIVVKLFIVFFVLKMIQANLILNGTVLVASNVMYFPE